MRDQDKTKDQLVEELTELRRCLDALVNNLPEGFFVVDAPDARIRLASRDAHQMFGVSREEFEGIRGDEHFRYYQVFHPNGVPAKLEELPLARAVFSGEVVRSEEWLLQVRDGTRFPILCHAGPIRDPQGRISGGVISWQNVADRKRAEEALRESEARYRALAESTKDFIYILDRDGAILYANRAASECIGIPCVQLVGKRQADLFPPEIALSHVERIGSVFATGEVLEADEYFSIGSEQVWLRVHLLPLRDEAGQVTSVMGVCHNITERKRAEGSLQKAHDELEEKVEKRTAELRQSEEKYRTLVEMSPDAVMMTDLEGHITFASQRAIELHGSERLDELLGRNPLDFFAPQDQPRFLATLKRSVEERVLRNLNFAFVTKEGKGFDGEISAAVISDSSGNPSGFVAILRDVTQRKQAEEALRQSERRFRNYFEQGLIGMAVTSVDKRWLEVNDRLCEIRGYSREELLQRSWAEVTHPDDLDADVQLFNRLLAGEIEHYTLDKRFFRKDGSIVYTTVHIRAVRKDDGTMDHIVALTEDITERKIAQDALAESEMKYRQLVETTDTGYLILDGQGRVIDANAEYVRISGHRTLQEILGRTVVEWTASYDVDRNAKEVEKCYQKGLVRQLEIDYVHPDGKIIPIDINATCLDTEDGRKIVCLCRDITERRHAQEALERERQSLWRMLQASDHERRIISYDIHDGLAQYLAAAGMQFQAHDSLRENSPDEAQKAYETAVELVRQSHAEARRLINEVRPPVIDENGIETAVSHLVHEQRQRGGPKIECHSDVQFGRLPSILENALYRIAQEALTNACKHSKSKRVTVSLTQEGQEASLKVQDWGIGFDPESVGKGHFGLEGIRQRVRLLGGRLTIESTPGSGTLVQVVVPILEQQAER